MKLKAIVFLLLASLVFLIADSKFHLLLFQDKSSPQAALNCAIVEQLNNLEIALDSKNSEVISRDINKLIFQMNLSYGYETNFSYFSKNQKTDSDSNTAQNIRDIRSQFDKYIKIDADSLSRYIPEIKSLRDQAQEALKDIC